MCILYTSNATKYDNIFWYFPVGIVKAVQSHCRHQLIVEVQKIVKQPVHYR